MDQHPESEIVSGLLNGDADAWRALYDQFAEPIWCFVARRMLPHSADVADVVQETFLAAAESVRTYDPKLGTLWQWLTGVARRHVACHYRKQRRQQSIREAVERLGAGSHQVLRWLENGESDPPAALDRQELALVIRATLSGLTNDYEQLLMWKYLDGEQVSEIATRLDLSETAVRSKLARARRAFRKAFSVRMVNDTLTRPGT